MFISKGRNYSVLIALLGLSLSPLSLAQAQEVYGGLSSQACEGADTGETYISGFTFRNKKVTYQKCNGLAIFQGDIILGTVEEAEIWAQAGPVAPLTEPLPHSIAITGDRYRWPNNTVPYQFSDDLSELEKDFIRDTIEEAIKHFDDNTEINIVLRTDSNADLYPNYVSITSDAGCYANVGMIGRGAQKINIGTNCSVGNTIHEFMHALGFYHEQSREDRDQYVKINEENILSGLEGNFSKLTPYADDIGPYDYGSIMHYDAYAFSWNGKPTIETIPPGIAIGQRDGLSDLDFEAIAFLYPFIPVAILDKSNYYAFNGSSLTFDAGNSFDPDGGALDYFWDFDDGPTRITETPITEHIYEDRGTYTVNLTITDPDAYSDSTSAEVTVYGIEVILPAILMGL